MRASHTPRWKRRLRRLFRRSSPWLLLLAVAAAVVLGMWGWLEPSVVGDAATLGFHRASCPSIQNTAPSQIVHFQNRSEAVMRGYQPCRRCRP